MFSKNIFCRARFALKDQVWKLFLAKLSLLLASKIDDTTFVLKAIDDAALSSDQ